MNHPVGRIQSWGLVAHAWLAATCMCVEHVQERVGSTVMGMCVPVTPSHFCGWVSFGCLPVVALQVEKKIGGPVPSNRATEFPPDATSTTLPAPDTITPAPRTHFPYVLPETIQTESAGTQVPSRIFPDQVGSLFGRALIGPWAGSPHPYTPREWLHGA